MAKTKVTKKQILDEKNPLVIESTFMLEQIQLKGMMWGAKIRIQEILPKSYHKYGIKVLFNEEPYMKRIERLEEKLTNSKTSKKLFADMDKEDIEEIKDEIKEIQKEMSDIKKQCLTIEFLATVEQIKYSNGNTNVALRIPDDVIEPINKAKTMFQYYKIELKPVF